MRSEIEIDASGVEYELGVPIAGRILAQDAWVKTALHRLPDGQFQAAEEFGRVAELILDLGCGNGRFTIGSAVARTECDHLAIDSLPVVIRYATRRGRQRGLSNTRFAVCDGMEFLRRWLPDQSVSELHIYHPQPFQEASQIDQRLFTPRFLAEAHRVLRTGGRMFLQSDNPAYWDYLRKSVGAIFAWHDQEGHGMAKGHFGLDVKSSRLEKASRSFEPGPCAANGAKQIWRLPSPCCPSLIFKRRRNAIGPVGLGEGSKVSGFRFQVSGIANF